MNKNRVISLILSLILLFCCVVNISAASEKNKAAEANEAVELLLYLDIFEKEDDLSEIVKRADFAAYIAKLIKITSAESNKQYYQDIEKGMWIAPYVNALTELGYFSGGGDAKFRPDDNLRYFEAVKVVMCMLGYRELCEAKGGYPTGYISLASQIDLIDKVSDDFITREQLAVLLYRALLEPIYTIKNVSGDSVGYTNDGNKTILSTYHNIHCSEGIVNAVGELALDSAKGVSRDRADVGGIIVKTQKLTKDMLDYLGMNIKMFYEGENDYYDAVLVFVKSNNNKIVEIDKDALMNIDDNGNEFIFTYSDENNRKRSINIPRGCVVIKNGESVKANLYNELGIENGTYRFLDHNNDGEYDVTFVNSYYNLFVGQVTNQEGMHYISFDGATEHYRGPVGSAQVLYDAYDSTLKVDVTEENDRIIKIKDANGNLDSINKIGKSEVVSVFASPNGKNVEIRRGKGSVKGSVSSVSTEDGHIKSISIGEVAYDVDTEVIERMPVVITPGFNGVFYLDFSGKIAAYTTANESNMSYGYLVKVHKESSGIRDDITIRMFDASNGLKDYKCAKTVKIDSVRKKTVDDIYAALSSHEKELVRFSTNDEGLLNTFDTVTHNADEGDMSLYKTADIDLARYSSTVTGFADSNNTNDHYKTVIRPTTPIFLVPTDATVASGAYEDSWFKVMQRSVLRGDAQYPKVSTYRINPHGGYEDIVVVKNDGRLDLPVTKAPLLISSVKTGYNADGNEVNIIEAYGENKNKQKYETTDVSVLSGYSLNCGDYVWFDFDPQDKICGVIDVLVDCGSTLTFKTQKAETATPGNYYSATMTAGEDISALRGSTLRGGMSVAYGYAYDITDGVMRFAFTKEDCAAENYVISRNISNALVLVCDRGLDKGEQIYWSSANDIVDYRRGGTECDHVVVSMRQGAVRCVIIYK